MDDVTLRGVRDFLNLTCDPEPMHWLDKPTGFGSALAKSNLTYQMRYSVELLESELARTDMRHVLQIVLEGGGRILVAVCRRHSCGGRQRRVRARLLSRKAACFRRRLPRCGVDCVATMLQALAASCGEGRFFCPCDAESFPAHDAAEKSPQ